MPTYVPILVVFVAALSALGGALVVTVLRQRRADRAPPALPEAYEEEHVVVDPWAYQRDLMAMSNQPLPQLPVVSHGSLLYYALMLEELAETGRALAASYHRCLSDPKTADEQTVLGKIVSVCGRMEESSALIRASLGHMEPFSYSLTAPEAEELLDGTTDVQVVNSGFALASGLPAQRAYVEVASSNLSKANPDTGQIEKSADGKWLKGKDYEPPRLGAVLQRHLDSAKAALRKQIEMEDIAAEARARRSRDICGND